MLQVWRLFDRLSSRMHGFDRMQVQAGFVVDTMTLGQVSLPTYFGCPCHYYYYYYTKAAYCIHLNATLMRRTSGEETLFRISVRGVINFCLCVANRSYFLKAQNTRNDLSAQSTANLCEYRNAVLLALSHLSRI